MPILPHRLELMSFADGEVEVYVHLVYDTVVAYYAYEEPRICENPFPPDDPRHALTGEILDLLDSRAPGWRGRRHPWHPNIVADYAQQVLERRRKLDAFNAWFIPEILADEAELEARRRRPRRAKRADD